MKRFAIAFWILTLCASHAFAQDTWLKSNCHFFRVYRVEPETLSPRAFQFFEGLRSGLDYTRKASGARLLSEFNQVCLENDFMTVADALDAAVKRLRGGGD